MLSCSVCVTLCNPRDHGLPGSTSPGKNAGVGCHALLQGIFPTQGLKPGLPYRGQILYHLSHHSIGKLKAVGTASRMSKQGPPPGVLLLLLWLSTRLTCLLACFYFELLPIDYPVLLALLVLCPICSPYLLRNLYAGQEATVRTGHGTTDWFQIEKGVRQDYILSPCLFNLYAEDIMKNAGLEEAQAGIKIAGRNINQLRYADDTTLMAESEEELKSLLMKVKVETEKVGLKLNIQKRKIMASGPITSWEIDRETVETVADFNFGGLQNRCGW